LVWCVFIPLTVARQEETARLRRQMLETGGAGESVRSALQRELDVLRQREEQRESCVLLLVTPLPLSANVLSQTPPL
jgi:hypothetical protein